MRVLHCFKWWSQMHVYIHIRYMLYVCVSQVCVVCFKTLGSKLPFSRKLIWLSGGIWTHDYTPLTSVHKVLWCNSQNQALTFHSGLIMSWFTCLAYMRVMRISAGHSFPIFLCWLVYIYATPFSLNPSRKHVSYPSVTYISFPLSLFVSLSSSSPSLSLSFPPLPLSLSVSSLSPVPLPPLSPTGERSRCWQYESAKSGGDGSTVLAYHPHLTGEVGTERDQR